MYWYHGFALLLAGSLLLALQAREIDRASWKRIGTAIAIGLALCLPFVLSLLGAWEALPGVALFSAADAGAADLPGHAPYWRAFDRESECREHCDRHAGCAGYSFRLAFATHVDYHRCWLIGRPSAARGRKHALIASALCRISQLG